MSDRQASRDDIADWTLDGETETWSWASSMKDWDSMEWHWIKSERSFMHRWRELGPTQNPVAHHRKGLRLVRHGHQWWLIVFYLSDTKKPGECSTGDAIHVLEFVKKYALVNCVKGSWKIQEHQKRNIAGVKCKKNVICYFEKGCFSAMVRVVSGLRRTDELVLSETG